MTPAEIIVYFENGAVYTTRPSVESLYESRGLFYDAVHIVSDGVAYNLTDIDSILSIEIPDFEHLCEDTTLSLDYIIRMKAGNYKNREERELCSACLWKSTELMLANKGCGWRREDFERIVYWHLDFGMFDEAKKAAKFLAQNESYIKSLTPFDSCAVEIRNTTLENAKKHNCDLVVFHDYGSGCCEECAKYRGRVYSISGCSPDFPPLPEYVKIHGNFHSGCRCAMSLYMGGTIYYKGEYVDALIASNRPFIDDRDEIEKERYQAYIEHSKKTEKQREQYTEYVIKKGINYNEYLALKDLLGDAAPKTYRSYIIAKNKRNEKFLTWLDAAQKHGISLSDSDMDK